MEKVVFFLDFANINRAARDRGVEMDYADLLNYVSEGRFLVDAHSYVPIDPRNEHRLDRKLDELWRSGYVVTTKVGSIAGDSYKCDFDVEITIDALRIAYQVKPDIIVLGTGDSDFVPLVQELRKSGIRVEVASFDDAAARSIILKCSGFVSLDYYLNERTATDGEIPEDNYQEIDDEDSGYRTAVSHNQQFDLEQQQPTDIQQVEPIEDLIQSQQITDDEEITEVRAETSPKVKRRRKQSNKFEKVQSRGD